MAEVERYESDIPLRYVWLQVWGHGPVSVRAPGVLMAMCIHPGCGWKGDPRTPGRDGDQEREADGKAHLDMQETP